MEGTHREWPRASCCKAIYGRSRRMALTACRDGGPDDNARCWRLGRQWTYALSRNRDARPCCNIPQHILRQAAEASHSGQAPHSTCVYSLLRPCGRCRGVLESQQRPLRPARMLSVQSLTRFRGPGREAWPRPRHPGCPGRGSWRMRSTGISGTARQH